MKNKKLAAKKNLFQNCKPLFFALLLPFLCIVATAQGVKISGVVKDPANKPLSGASVSVQGEFTTTATDANGKYTITAPGTNATLVFSFTGYTPITVSLNGKTIVNVDMLEDTKALEQVVVVGYGTQKKSLVTGAIASIKSDQITRVPAYNPDQALQGQVSGVVVMANSGQPGAGISLRIRGTTTPGNAQPLYVIDGLPTGSMATLNPADIESIEVLKDAASAAIYGARGANGVILVRTKNGKNGKLVLEFDSYYGIQSPQKKVAVMNASQYFDYAKAANMYDLRYNGSVDPSITNLLATENDVYALVGKQGTDWQSLIFSNNAPIYNNQLSLRGGNEKTIYSTSLSYLSQDGVIAKEKSNFKKYTARFNSQTQFSKSVRIGSNIAYNYQRSQGIADNGTSMTPVNSSINFNPLTTVFDADGNYSKDNLGVSEVYNPVGIIYINNGLNKSDQLLGNLYTDITPAFLPGFTFRSSFNLEINNSKSTNFSPIFNLGPGFSREKSGVRANYSRSRSYIWENTINYQKKIKEHEFTTLAGISLQEGSSDYLSGSKDGVLLDDIRFAEIDAATDFDSRRVSGSSESNSLVSYFGRLNYSYANKYMLTATVRVDGSSNFGPNNRFATFPSFSVGWNIANESFMDNIKSISTLKLRGSWGSNGNQSIGSFGYLALYSSGVTFVNDDPTVYYQLQRLSNPNLKWETTNQTNVGIDLGLWGEKLTVVADYYIKKTKDLLVYLTPPSLFGIPQATAYNAGNVENKGFELQLNWKDRIGNLSYNIGANASFNKNTMTFIGNENGEIWGNEFIVGGITTAVTKGEAGRPIGYFYGYKTDGIFNDQAEIDNYKKDGTPIQPEATPGDIKYADISGDGIISSDDRTMIGTPHPDFVFGFNLGVSYKNFDMNTLIQGVSGNNVIASYWSFMGGEAFGNKPVSALNGWSDNNTNATLPRPTFSAINRQRVSDMWVQDGSYLRIKNIQIGYTLPVGLTKRAAITKCRFYISAQNLATFTKYSGFDPEVGGSAMSAGIDGGVYPQPRMFIAGLNLAF